MHLTFKSAVRAAFAVVVAVAAVPALARVASSQTIVSTSDTVNAIVSSTDACVESNLFLYVGLSMSPNQGQPPTAGGSIFYTRYDECTGQHLAGINQSFSVESGGLSVNGDLKYGMARFTTSAIEQVSHGVVAISVDLTFTATGDMQHNHNQGIFYGDGFASVSQDSEWFRPADVTGTFSVGGVGGTAEGHYASMARGKSTIVIQTFGPPFPQ